MIYLPSEAKLWYTGCPLCSLSCSSWYSPRLPGYFSDDDPLLLSWIFRGYNGFLGSISLNKNSIGTYSYDKVVHLIQDGGQWCRQPPIQFVIQIYYDLVICSNENTSNTQSFVIFPFTVTKLPAFSRYSCNLTSLLRIHQSIPIRILPDYSPLI